MPGRGLPRIYGQRAYAEAVRRDQHDRTRETKVLYRARKADGEFWTLTGIIGSSIAIGYALGLATCLLLGG